MEDFMDRPSRSRMLQEAAHTQIFSSVKLPVEPETDMEAKIVAAFSVSLNSSAFMALTVKESLVRKHFVESFCKANDIHLTVSKGFYSLSNKEWE